LAVLLIGLLHFVTDEYQPDRTLQRVHERMPAGTHEHAETHSTPAKIETVMDRYQHQVDNLRLRTKDEIHRLMAGFELIPPGVVWIPLWRPDDPTPVTRPETSGVYGAMGRRP
jgi:hypothetical protein